MLQLFHDWEVSCSQMTKALSLSQGIRPLDDRHLALATIWLIDEVVSSNSLNDLNEVVWVRE